MADQVGLYFFLHPGQNVFMYFSYRLGLNTQRKISAINGMWQPNKTLRNVVRISMGTAVATYILAIFVLYIFLHA